MEEKQHTHINGDIKSIDIVFENCDYVNVPAEHILYLYFDKINRQIFTDIILQVIDMQVAETTIIYLKESAFDLETWLSSEKDKIILKDRILNFNDITSIEIHYNDENKASDHIYTSWGGDDDYNNPNQHSSIENDLEKGIRIYIGEDENANTL